MPRKHLINSTPLLIPRFPTVTSRDRRNKVNPPKNPKRLSRAGNPVQQQRNSGSGKACRVRPARRTQEKSWYAEGNRKKSGNGSFETTANGIRRFRFRESVAVDLRKIRVFLGQINFPSAPRRVRRPSAKPDRKWRTFAAAIFRVDCTPPNGNASFSLCVYLLLARTFSLCPLSLLFRQCVSLCSFACAASHGSPTRDRETVFPSHTANPDRFVHALSKTEARLRPLPAARLLSVFHSSDPASLADPRLLFHSRPGPQRLADLRSKVAHRSGNG